MKENSFYVAEDYKSELNNFETNNSKQEYILPDGEVINYDSVLNFKHTENYFNLKYFDTNTDSNVGIHNIINQCLNKCDWDIQRDISQNVVLSGGSSMFKGFGERLYDELYNIQLNSSNNFKVYANHNRDNNVWLGGSILGSLKSFETNMMISLDEYEESGERIILQKCF